MSEYIEASANDMLPVVREQGLEGIVAKRRDSLYDSGKRTGAWIKYGVNRGQEFVIGGYLLGPHGLDSLIVGYYRGEDLIYVARVRNGLVPASRRDVFEKLRGLVSPTCPFVNLPDKHRSRWGDALTADKMKKCVWLHPSAWHRSSFCSGPQGIVLGTHDSRGSGRTRNRDSREGALIPIGRGVMAQGPHIRCER
jgi:ATP-dependent DNA ligase